MNNTYFIYSNIVNSLFTEMTQVDYLVIDNEYGIIEEDSVNLKNDYTGAKMHLAQICIKDYIDKFLLDPDNGLINEDGEKQLFFYMVYTTGNNEFLVSIADATNLSTVKNGIAMATGLSESDIHDNVIGACNPKFAEVFNITKAVLKREVKDICTTEGGYAEKISCSLV